ncbi:MAG: ChaN family lipoprotein [Deltaproteobacteria bacterium]|nr:ChaN family lipoprotein [Deltaproteobacteria bacterium]
MWSALIGLGAAALAGQGCEQVGMDALAGVQAPAVIVLGERRGTEPDLYRASRVVTALARRAPVRLALEAVGVEQQGLLDAYGRREIEPEDLAAELDWSSHWGYPYLPYARLLAHARHGVEVVGIGQDLRAHSEPVPVPSGYAGVLRDAMAGHEAPPQVERDLLRYVAWRDNRLAVAALDGWDRQGFLVIVVDRVQVEGGKGVPWQVAKAGEVPVHAITLAWADAPCFEGDQVWRPWLLDPDRVR